MKETTKKKILPPKVGTALKSNTPIKPPKVVKQAGEPVSEEFVQDSSDSEDTGPPKDKSEKAKGKKPALKPTRIEPQSKPHPKPQSKPLRKLNEQSEKTSRQNKPVNGVVDVPRVPLPPKAKSSPPETTRAVPSDSGSSDKGEEEQSDSASDSAGGKDTGSDSEDSESGVEESDATAGKTAVRTVEEYDELILASCCDIDERTGTSQMLETRQSSFGQLLSSYLPQTLRLCQRILRHHRMLRNCSISLACLERKYGTSRFPLEYPLIR
jgi:hypothetical protein